MVSRSTSIQGLFILREFEFSQVSNKPAGESEGHLSFALAVAGWNRSGDAFDGAGRPFGAARGKTNEE